MKTAEKASHTQGPCYANEDCACQVLGDGTERNPFDINYCAKHAFAPEMLEALKLAIAVFVNENCLNVTPDEAADIIQATIDKAKGETL